MSRRLSSEFATYADYLRSAHWQDVRRRYRASRLPWRCDCCEAEGVPLDLHHKTYKRIGRESLTDLIPLCRPCHTDVHQLVARKGGGLWAASRVLRRRRYGRR